MNLFPATDQDGHLHTAVGDVLRAQTRGLLPGLYTYAGPGQSGGKGISCQGKPDLVRQAAIALRLWQQEPEDVAAAIQAAAKAWKKWSISPPEDRAAVLLKAADLLAKLGYTHVYSITDGYEGDKAKQGEHAGQRVVNGWRNAGLPWTYTISEAMAWSE